MKYVRTATQVAHLLESYLVDPPYAGILERNLNENKSSLKVVFPDETVFILTVEKVK